MRVFTLPPLSLYSLYTLLVIVEQSAQFRCNVKFSHLLVVIQVPDGCKGPERLHPKCCWNCVSPLSLPCCAAVQNFVFCIWQSWLFDQYTLGWVSKFCDLSIHHYFGNQGKGLCIYDIDFPFVLTVKRISINKLLTCRNLIRPTHLPATLSAYLLCFMWSKLESYDASQRGHTVTSGGTWNFYEIVWERD